MEELSQCFCHTFQCQYSLGIILNQYASHSALGNRGGRDVGGRRLCLSLKSVDAVVNVIDRSEVGTMFCLSWLITWYGHVLSEFRHIVRLYDFFMACHPLMPIYLAADVNICLLIYFLVSSHFYLAIIAITLQHS